MELEDLKEAWNKQDTKDSRSEKLDIAQLIQNRNYGPIICIKQRVRKQLLIIILFISTIVFNFLRRPSLVKEPLMFVSMVVMIFCLIYVLFNYYIVSRMYNSIGDIKTSITKNIVSFEKGIKIFNWISTFLLIFLAITIEYYPGLKEFGGFFKLPLMLRIIFYLVMLLFFFFLRQYLNYRRFGRYIEFLKDLLNKMD